VRERLTSPRLALAVAAVAISTSAILIRWSSAPPVVAAFYRVLLTVVLLAPLTLDQHAHRLGELSQRHLFAAGVTGLALAAHFATWFESLSWTSVAASVTIVQSQPIFVVAGAWLLLNERVTRRTVAGVVVAILGVVVMSLGDFVSGTAVGARPLYGNALALVGAFMAAGYVLAGRSLRQRLPLLPYVTVVYGVAAVALLAVALVQGSPLLGYENREWLLFLAMAIGPGILGHTLVNYSLAHIESSLVSVTLLVEPLGSALLALLLLSEVPSLWTVIGGAVVLGGIAITSRTRSDDV